MKNNKLIRLVESFIIFPIISMSVVPVGPISQSAMNIAIAPQTISPQHNINLAYGALNIQDIIDQKLEEQKIKAEAIDAYFRAHEMPLAGQGMKMVLEAERNQLDWRLLPAIAVRESTGGKNACDFVKNNPFGWGSCKIGFKSSQEVIEIVARNLGGNNPKTAYHYDSKTTEGILHAYNPPSIVPKYAEQVMSIMDDIGDSDMTLLAIATT